MLAAVLVWGISPRCFLAGRWYEGLQDNGRGEWCDGWVGLREGLEPRKICYEKAGKKVWFAMVIDTWDNHQQIRGAGLER